MTTPADRHLSTDSFAAYLRSPVPIDHPIPGSPRIVLFVDPHTRRVGLRGPGTPHEAPPAGLENLTVRAVHHDGQRMIEIAVTDPRLFTDAYPLLCAVADRVQLDQQTMTAALTETLRRLGHLLQAEDVLSQEKETGLVGELLILAGLTHTLGPDTALASWRGGQAEEHDFGLPDHDIEVKTTVSEHRAHWISSLTQMVETGDRPLWLLSLQITSAGSAGRTLPDLITGVRALLPSTAQRTGFDDRLRSSGWRDRYAATCQRRWRLRTPPLAFRVTESFPRLTPRLLTDAGVDGTHVTDVRYRLDLTGRAGDRAPQIITDVLTRGQLELP
ncbi:PD-(D/E)XK motif protein [Micromonospora sp. C28SCA-DRY-2]|uniref:PD-(D/E)XK motif protein n=1 Tax=Micromonospora sp. C28SCA-DRY-2 TaxID=3059522 RepID=UPI002675FD1E|nr:PD-(D/E)XK motif protein [Micromonospora sp. C28SCA-DRY-2]MDO3704074.1 PD-(D/E)XK motif protein [Micromonospora sp. C28SCA-DRY-2]